MPSLSTFLKLSKINVSIESNNILLGSVTEHTVSNHQNSSSVGHNPVGEFGDLNLSWLADEFVFFFCLSYLIALTESFLFLLHLLLLKNFFHLSFLVISSFHIVFSSMLGLLRNTCLFYGLSKFSGLFKGFFIVRIIFYRVNLALTMFWE